jgi:hypothetical protein
MSVQNNSQISIKDFSKSKPTPSQVQHASQGTSFDGQMPRSSNKSSLAVAPMTQTAINFSQPTHARAASTLGVLNKAQLGELNITGRNFEAHHPSTYKQYLD